jgi:hypothetical protein
MQMQMKEVDQ